MPQTKKQFRPIGSMLYDAWHEVMDRYGNYFKSILVSFAVFSVTYIIVAFISYEINSYFFNGGTQFNIISTNIGFNAAVLIITFIALIYTQGLFISTSLRTDRFHAVVRRVNRIFVDFLLLGLLLLVLGYVALSPIYAIAFVVLTNPDFGIVLPSALFLLTVMLVLLFSVWFILTPYIMIDKTAKIGETLKKNFSLIRGRFGPMLSRLLVFYLLLFVFQFGLTYAVSFSLLGDIIIILINILLIVPYTYSYFHILYTEASKS